MWNFLFQQIAKHQLEADTDPQSLLTTALSDEINTQSSDNIVTMVTEITTEASEVKNNLITISSANETDIGNV